MRNSSARVRNARELPQEACYFALVQSTNCEAFTNTKT